MLMNIKELTDIKDHNDLTDSVIIIDAVDIDGHERTLRHERPKKTLTSLRILKTLQI